MENYDFSGWVTKHGIKCSDGRTITSSAFKHCDGLKVPLVWNHKHDDPSDVLGHVYLEHRDEGVYGYGAFNEEENGLLAKGLVMHGDIDKLSIYANQLKQNGRDVIHGMIREVSLVHAGANPGAYIENVIRHSADGDAVIVEDECRIYTDERISLYHSEEKSKEKEKEPVAENVEKKETKEKTVKEVLEQIEKKLDEDEKTVFYGLIGMAYESDDEDDDDDDAAEHSDIDEDFEGGNEMKHNVFDQDEQQMDNVLTHSDQAAIMEIAKKPGYTFKTALKEYTEDNEALAHGFDTEALTELMPDYKNLTPGAPDILRADQSWVMKVINKVHKSPFSRVRTRHADARAAELKAKGYNNREEEKKLTDTIQLIKREFAPQTIYIRDKMHRDDIIDMTEFDVVAYVWNLMKDNMYETLALATLIGDGRDELHEDKIKEAHFRSIWHDDDLYTMHKLVDIEAARSEIQGTNTSANFSENYIYAEAIIRDSLYAREKFKGSGKPDFYCAPHLVNVMLLARDLNGRRIYNDKSDLARALNVNEIVEIEQFDGKTRVDSDGKTRKLLGIFVNLADYQYGSTKGGEITKFDDFDIKFNTYDYLMETRLSGALTKIESAIALEELVEVAAG